MRPIICVEQLGKEYCIGAREEPYSTLRESLTRALCAPFTRVRQAFQAAQHAFRQNSHPLSPANSEVRNRIWALKAVSFEVQPGEVVGVIGRNGAGKSTLLKILSRITEPTTGCINLYGRVASLLEVGTGFHSELSGRENIFLNGAILGMSRKEIARKFDEIVAFAEVEKFLDTPVKRYSSGMYMRLAFALAAHLEPEILMVDEVLAVGDADFQKKCLGKMGEVARGGRTVLFVSHNMPSVRHLCSRVILLEDGHVAEDGPPAEVISSYYMRTTTRQDGDLRDWAGRDSKATGEARIIRFAACASDSQEPGCMRMGQSVRMSMDVDFLEAVDDPTFGILVHSMAGEPLLDLRSVHSGMHVGRIKGLLRIETTIPSLALYPGEYLLSPWVADRAQRVNFDWLKNVFVLLISPSAEHSSDLHKASSWGRYWVPSHWRSCAKEAAPESDKLACDN